MGQAASLKQGVQQDEALQLVRTARIPTGAFVVGDADQVSADPNVIAMNGNDMLYLYVDVTFDGGGMTRLDLLVEFSATGNNAVAADWYTDSGLEPAALAAGDILVGVGQVIYTFTVTGRRRLIIPMDDRAARVSIRAGAGGPAGDDSVGIQCLRRIRDSVVGPG